MEQPKQSFFQRHPGFDAYSLFWLVLFLILAALGRFFLPLLIPAGVVLVYLLFRLLVRDYQKNSYIDPKRREPLNSLRFCFVQRKTLTRKYRKRPEIRRFQVLVEISGIEPLTS